MDRHAQLFERQREFGHDHWLNISRHLHARFPGDRGQGLSLNLWVSEAAENAADCLQKPFTFGWSMALAQGLYRQGLYRMERMLIEIPLPCNQASRNNGLRTGQDHRHDNDSQRQEKRKSRQPSSGAHHQFIPWRSRRRGNR